LEEKRGSTTKITKATKKGVADTEAILS